VEGRQRIGSKAGLWASLVIGKKGWKRGGRKGGTTWVSDPGVVTSTKKGKGGGIRRRLTHGEIPPRTSRGLRIPGGYSFHKSRGKKTSVGRSKERKD